MSYYKIVKTFDPNDYFIIKGASLEDALYNALMEVGWRCVKVDEVEDDNFTEDTEEDNEQD